MCNTTEHIKGAVLRYMETRNFFEENPELIGRVVFALMAVEPLISSTSAEASEIDRFQSTAAVTNLNDKFGCEVVHYEEVREQDISLWDRLAFFAACDVLILSVIP